MRMSNSSTYTGTMARAALCMVVISFLLMLHSSEGDAGEILVEPKTQAALQGTNATFFCSGRGSITYWIINSTEVKDNTVDTFIRRGFIFQMKRVHISNNHEENINNLTMTILATIGNNNTEIRCISAGAQSDVVYLVVIGNFSPAQLAVGVVNATTLKASWEQPFTITGYEILHYDVTVENKTTGESIIDSVRINGSEGEREVSVSSPDGEIARECNEITFTVTATNVLGESDPATVSGWLPIAPGPFPSPPEIEVLFESDGTAVATITFELPHACPSQEVKYTIIIEGTKDGSVIDVIVIGPKTVLYEEGRVVVENTTGVGKLETDAHYGATIDVKTVAGSRTSTASADLTPDDVGGQNQSNNDSTITAVTVPVCLGIVLLVVVITVVIVILLYKKVQSQAKDETRNSPIPPMVSNPIYEPEEPVYETIDEAAIKFRSSLPVGSPVQEPSIPSQPAPPIYENSRPPQPNERPSTDLPTVIPSDPVISEDSYTSGGTKVFNSRPKVFNTDEPPRSEIIRYVQT